MLAVLQEYRCADLRSTCFAVLNNQYWAVCINRERRRKYERELKSERASETDRQTDRQRMGWKKKRMMIFYYVTI